MIVAQLRERLREGAISFGYARWTIVGFLLLLWISAGLLGLSLGRLFGDCLVRSGMNGVLVLALLLPVRAGNGLNFGIPLGIVCGLLAGVFVMELNATHPFGVEAWEAHADLSKGWSGFTLAHLIALPLAAVVGWGYGWLLERVRGQEMMVGIYVGFGAIAGMCVLWLKLPVTYEELIWPIGGEGVRNTILIDDYYKWILDGWMDIDFGESGRKFQRSEAFFIPTGLLIYWLGACGLIAMFLRTRSGIAMSAAGESPAYARSIGISVSKMRIRSTVISTVLAAAGILVYTQSYGFYQLYKAPLWMAFPAVAALLLGGASLRNATIFHVIVGTVLFQSLLTTSLPVVNKLVYLLQQNEIVDVRYSSSLGNIPEIARLIIQNGVILYALSRVARDSR